MPAKFFCNKCGKEIFQDMENSQKETTSVAEIEKVCECSDCMFKELKKD